MRYPTACSPQAWATAAPFLFLKTMLGIDVLDGKVVSDAVVPEHLGNIFLHGIHALGSHYDVNGHGTTGEVAETP